MTAFKKDYKTFAKSIIAQYPNHHILIFGRPGAGKGTLADLFAAAGFVHVGVGRLIREHLRNDTSLSRRFESELADKLILPDPLASNMVLHELQLLTDNKSNLFVLEGYPATQGQYVAFKEFIDSNAAKLVVIILDVSEAEAEKRLLSRKTCPYCHRAYSLSDEKCLQCGISLYIRKDDQLNLIRERQALFVKETHPLRKQFQSASPFIIKSFEKTF